MVFESVQACILIFQIGWGYQPIPYDDPYFNDLHMEWKYRKMESQAEGWALRFSAQVSRWHSGATIHAIRIFGQLCHGPLHTRYAAVHGFVCTSLCK